MCKPAKTTYKTKVWHEYNQTLKQRRSLTAWFDPEMPWEAPPSGMQWRQHFDGKSKIWKGILNSN